MSLCHPRHAIRAATSGDIRCGGGIGLVVHDKTRHGAPGPSVLELSERCPVGDISWDELAIHRALTLAADAGWTTIEIGMTLPRMRVLREAHRAGELVGGTAMEDLGLVLARSFDHVFFRWIPCRARQLAQRASGIELRRSTARAIRARRDIDCAPWE